MYLEIARRKAVGHFGFARQKSFLTQFVIADSQLLRFICQVFQRLFIIADVDFPDLALFFQPQFQLTGEIPFNNEGVPGIIIRQIFVVGMCRDVVLVRQKGSDPPQLQDALAAIHHCQLIHGHQGLSEFLVVQAVRYLTSPALAGIEGVDGLLAEEFFHLLQRCLFLASQEKQRVAVSDDRVRVVLVNRLQLGLSLQHDAGGNLPAADRRDQLLEIRNLADVGKLIDQAANMHRQASAMLIVRFFAEQIEYLRIGHADQEIEAGIRIRHDQEQRCALLAQGIQVKLIVGRDVTKLLDIKDCKPSAAGNQD